MRLYELLKEMYDEDDFNKVFGICPTCKQKKSKCQCELDEGVSMYGAEGKPEWFDRAVALKKANPRITAAEMGRQLGVNSTSILYWLTGLSGPAGLMKRPKDSFPFEPGAFPTGTGQLKYTDGAKPKWYDQALQMAKAGMSFIAIGKKLGVGDHNIGNWLVKGKKWVNGKIVNPDAELEPRKIRGKKLDVNLLMDFISTGYTDEDIIELIVDEKGPKIASQVKNMLPILRKKLNPGTQVIDKTATGINNPDISSVVPESRENLDEDIGDDQYPDITQSKKEEIIHAWEYQEDLIDIGNGYQILSGENHGRADNVALLIGPDYKIKDEDTDIEKLLDNNFGIIQGENFADGKKKGKSRPGRVKRSGASCNGSVTALRKRAKNSSGEKAKMLHWCANMKSGKQKSK